MVIIQGIHHTALKKSIDMLLYLKGMQNWTRVIQAQRVKSEKSLKVLGRNRSTEVLRSPSAREHRFFTLCGTPKMLNLSPNRGISYKNYLLGMSTFAWALNQAWNFSYAERLRHERRTTNLLEWPEVKWKSMVRKHSQLSSLNHYSLAGFVGALLRVVLAQGS